MGGWGWWTGDPQEKWGGEENGDGKVVEKIKKRGEKRERKEKIGVERNGGALGVRT